MGGMEVRGRGKLSVVLGASAVLLAGLLVAMWLDGDVAKDPSVAVRGRQRSSISVEPAAASHVPTTATTDAPTTTTTEATTTTTVPRGPESITMVFAGDLLPHMAVNDKAAAYGAESSREYDYRPMFEPMSPILEEADLALCHMEVPTVPEGEPITSYPSFGAPPELATDAGESGYDGCSTASNHSLDRGRAGLDRLLDTFDVAGMGHSGTARTEDEGDGRASVYDVDGVKVAHLSYAYDFNGYKIPEDAPWSVNQIDPAKIIRRSEEARADGADLVVVSLHWGAEYVHDPNDQQELWAQQILESPAIDLLIGHHAHVVQPISKVKDRYVVWGLGNQLSNQTQLPRRDGLTVRAHAGRDEEGTWGIEQIDAIPTFVDLSTFRILPVVETLRDGGETAEMTDALRASYQRTAEVIERRPTEGVELALVP